MDEPNSAAFFAGFYKCVPEDFEVEEVLGFEPDGEGEHWLLKVEKRGLDTARVADWLASYARVPRLAVGFAGRKDRWAVAIQHFTVKAPRMTSGEWLRFAPPGVRVLKASRHRRKLPRGAHRGNRFRVRLRGVMAAPTAIAERLERLAREGFPNAFGAQRFGHGQANLEMAKRPRQRSRRWREFALSAARAALFNAILAERVASGTWNRLLPGDLAILDGRGSFFPVPDPSAPDLIERLNAALIHPSGALWGVGPTPAGGEPARLESAVAAAHPDWVALCEEAGLRHGRRALRAIARDFRFAFENSQSLVIECTLARGTYMTVLLERLGGRLASAVAE